MTRIFSSNANPRQRSPKSIRQPLKSEEAAERNAEIDAWQGAANDYQGPKAVIWGRTLGWTSPSGIDWTPMPEPLGVRAVNGGICARYDTSSGQYISYLQVMGDESEAEFPQVGSGRTEVETQRRTIAFSNTKDFAKWPAPKLIFAPDPQDGYDVCFCESLALVGFGSSCLTVCLAVLRRWRQLCAPADTLSSCDPPS